MLEIMDYIVIGYLVILCLLSAYLRRNNENKLRMKISYVALIFTCLFVVGYLTIYNLVDNREKYLIYFLIISCLILITSLIISYYIFTKKKEENIKEIVIDEEEKNI